MIKKNHHIILVLITLVLVLSLNGCKHKKNLQKNTNVNKVEGDSLEKCRLDFKNSKSLIKHISENETKYNWLFLKSNVNTLIDGEEKSFDAKVRLRKDSLMLITIELLSFDFAKVLISKDSIKMVDYHNKKYFKGDFLYINNLLNADLDFNVIQSVIIGNSAEFLDDDEKIKAVTDRTNCNYKLSTERKKKLKKIEKGEQDLKKALQIITLNPDNFKIVKNEFIDPSTNRSFLAEYSNFKNTDSVYAPFNVNIDIRAQRKMNIKIEYVRMEINKPQRFNFNIPAKYDPIEIQTK